MKRLLLPMLFALTSTAAAQDWALVPLGTSVDILAIENTSFPEKIVVGRDGFVAQSSSGRTAWTPIDVGTSLDLLSVHQPSLGQLWVGGEAGVVRRKIGGSWEGRPIPSAEDFTIFTRSSGASWAVGSGGSIYRTTNGGTSWDLSHSAGVALHDGSGFIGSRAYVVGDDGTFLTTPDGGTTWNQYATGTDADLYSFTAGPTGGHLACGEGGTILRTTDSGETWTSIDSGTGATLYALSVSKQNANWMLCVGEGGTVLKSTNAGVDWCFLDTGHDADYHGVEMVTNSEYLVAGVGGLMVRSTTSGGDCLETVHIDDVAHPPALQLSIRPNPLRAGTVIEFTLDGTDARTVRVFDAAGRRVGSYPLTHGRASVSTTRMAPGVYFASAEGATRRFVVSP
jgi:photosystem II stability/assembly factor-like uncharacterized protein